jgi:hypothetical protein
MQDQGAEAEDEVAPTEDDEPANHETEAANHGGEPPRIPPVLQGSGEGEEGEGDYEKALSGEVTSLPPHTREISEPASTQTEAHLATEQAGERIAKTDRQIPNETTQDSPVTPSTNESTQQVEGSHDKPQAAKPDPDRVQAPFQSQDKAREPATHPVKPPTESTNAEEQQLSEVSETNSQQDADIEDNEIITNMERYLQVEREQQWTEAYHDAQTYIGTLYDTFTPEISKDARTTGTLLGAIGLAASGLRYGKNEQQLKLYSGTYEQNVVGAYHHENHSRDFIRNLFVYATAVNERYPETYTEEHFTRFPGIGAFHDIVMGEGRGNDEHLSAILAITLMRDLAFTMLPDRPTEAAIHATTWSDEQKAQSVNPQSDYLEYEWAAGVADFLQLFDRRGPYLAICVAIEDFSKKRYDQVFTQEAIAAGFQIAGASIDDCIAFIDQSPILRELYTEFLGGQAAFFEHFRPADPELDDLFPGRQANIAFMQELAQDYANGRKSALDTLLAAREYMNS